MNATMPGPETGTAEGGAERAQGPLVRVDVAGMAVQGARGTFSDYWVRCWDARRFMLHEARAKISGRAGRDKLGNLWLVIDPILMGAMFYVIFGLLLQVSRGIENYIGFLCIGIFMFTLTNGIIGQSADAVYANRSAGAGVRYNSLVKIGMVNVRVWMAGLPSYFVLLLFILLLPPGEHLSLRALLFLPIIAAQAALAFGISLVLGHLVARVSDLKHLVGFAQRAWLFSSGVFFSVDRILDRVPQLAPFVDYNPMHHILDMSRAVLLYDTMPSAFGWNVVALWTVASLLLGSWILWRAEGTYGFDED